MIIAIIVSSRHDPLLDVASPISQVLTVVVFQFDVSNQSYSATHEGDKNTLCASLRISVGDLVPCSWNSCFLLWPVNSLYHDVRLSHKSRIARNFKFDC
jgi:hypothetical protein